MEKEQEEWYKNRQKELLEVINKQYNTLYFYMGPDFLVSFGKPVLLVLFCNFLGMFLYNFLPDDSLLNIIGLFISGFGIIQFILLIHGSYQLTRLFFQYRKNKKEFDNINQLFLMNICIDIMTKASQQTETPAKDQEDSNNS